MKLIIDKTQPLKGCEKITGYQTLVMEATTETTEQINKTIEFVGFKNEIVERQANKCIWKVKYLSQLNKLQNSILDFVKTDYGKTYIL